MDGPVRPESGTISEAIMYFENQWQEMPKTEAQAFADLADQWENQVLREGFSEPLLDTIVEVIGDYEDVYPEEGVWDSVRGYFASLSFAQENLSPTLTLLFSMQSPMKMATTLMACMGTESKLGQALFISYRNRYQERATPDDFTLFMQTCINRIIFHDPSDRSIDANEDIIRRKNPDYDAVKEWARAEQEATDVDKDEILQLIHNKAVWANMPARYRFQAVMRFMRHHSQLRDELSTEQVLSILDQYSRAESAFPEATIWNECRFALGHSLINKGYPLFAFDFGRAMTRGESQLLLVNEFIAKGMVDEALELTMLIKEPPIMVGALMGDFWENEEGTTSLAEYLDDEGNSLERRIACLEVLVAGAETTKDPDQSALKELLDELKKQAALEAKLADR